MREWARILDKMRQDEGGIRQDKMRQLTLPWTRPKCCSHLSLDLPSPGLVSVPGCRDGMPRPTDLAAHNASASVGSRSDQTSDWVWISIDECVSVLMGVYQYWWVCISIDECVSVLMWVCISIDECVSVLMSVCISIDEHCLGYTEHCSEQRVVQLLLLWVISSLGHHHLQHLFAGRHAIEFQTKQVLHHSGKKGKFLSSSLPCLCFSCILILQRLLFLPWKKMFTVPPMLKKQLPDRRGKAQLLLVPADRIRWTNVSG